MNVDVISAAADVTPEKVAGRTAVVIDVFRATSVIVAALEAGARAVVPTMTVDEAFAQKADLQMIGIDVLLGGERNAVMIEGFDKDNSPRAYTPEDVAGRTIVFTTTNGTLAIRNAAAAKRLFIGAMTNFTAAVEMVAASGDDVVLICSGCEGHFTIEDALCAGMMSGRLQSKFGAELTDMAWVLADMARRHEGNVRGLLANCQHYNNIMRRGFGADIEYCLSVDTTTTVPYWNGRDIGIP